VIGALLIIAVLIGAWELYVDLGGVDDLVLAAPSQIAQALWDDRGLLASNFATTAQEVCFGILAGLILGFALAVAIHFSPTLRRTLYPLMVGSQAVPIPIVAPLLVYWLGFGILPKLVIIASICFFPIVVATADGLARVDPELHKLMHTLDASRWQTFRFTELPSALPAAISGARIAVAIAVIAAVFAELSGSTSGLGRLTKQAGDNLEIARAYAAVVVLVVFAIVLFILFGIAERQLLRHQPKDHTR
jgi:NitT/TauT family transport system permease protein/putative hydroxymethylpyrimidine transport system permease protein